MERVHQRNIIRQKNWREKLKVMPVLHWGGEGRNGPVPAGQVRCQPFISGEKVTPQTPDGVCNMGALRFAMKLVLSGSVGASAAIELGVTADWSGEMGKGYGIKGRPATLTAPPLPGQQQVNLKTSTIPEAQGEVKLVFLLVLRREVISVVPLSGLTRILMIRQ